jgi:hypothetical protein
LDEPGLEGTAVFREGTGLTFFANEFAPTNYNGPIH